MGSRRTSMLCQERPAVPRSKASPPPVPKPLSDAEQSRRFIEAARELGCEENFEQFEEALKVIVRAPPRLKTPSKPKPR
jgi:hypothetical protein